MAGLLADGEVSGETLFLTPDPPDGGAAGGNELRGVLAMFGENPTDTLFFSLDLPLP